MKKHKKELYNDPWDRDYYETGCTRPPKNRGGLIAVLLTAVIILGSACSMLGLLNAQLFRLLTMEDPAGENMVLFDGTSETAPTSGTVPAAEKVVLTLADLEDGESADGCEQARRSLVQVLCGSGACDGVILTGDGYILTDAAVITPGSSISVMFSTGMKLSAALIATDEAAGIAVLRIQATGLTAAQLGNSDQLQPEAPVTTVGFAPDSTGEPGCLLTVNSQGQVVAIRSIPTAQLKPMVEQLIEVNTLGSACLQLEYETASDFDRRFYELPKGVLVTGVTDGGCSDLAGIRSGDVITALEGETIETEEALSDALDALAPGDSITLSLYRSQTDQELTVKVTLSKEDQ